MIKNTIYTLLLVFCPIAASALDVNELRVMSLQNPTVVDADTPLFSWKLTSDERSVVQSAYRIIITTDATDGSVFYDTGYIESDESLNVPLSGLNLQPSTRYYWSVSVQDNKGNEATSSETAWFDTGLMSSDWGDAIWIKASDEDYGTEIEDVEDYTIEYKFQIEHTAAGLCFATKDTNNFYMWQFNTTDTSNPTFRPHIWSGGSASLITEIAIGDKVALNNDEEFTARIEITEGGTHAATYLNNVLIDERDGDFVYGILGIRQDYGSYDGKTENAYFDDFVVTSSEGTILFEEDFSETKKFSAGTIVDGRLYVVGTTSGASTYAWQTDGEYIKYTVEADMTLINDNASIVFAATGSTTYHMWQVNTADGDNPLIRHHIYNNSTSPSYNDSEFTQFTKDEILNVERHITIEVIETTINTYIDDILVDTYTDNSGILTKGDIGLRVDNTASSNTVDEEAYFDNLLVTEYTEAGTSKVTLSEDFEGDTSDYFYSPTIVVVDGNRKCHMTVSGKEYRMMQVATEGSPLFRKDFTVSDGVASARLYTTAMGVYDVFINGERVGHVLADGTTEYEELKPGWTDYTKRVFYQSHDVTSMLQEGDNVLGAVVTSGWWAGDIAQGYYGSPETGFIARLEITYDDGTTETIVTDSSWGSYTNGAVRQGEIYDGEIYDARKVVDWSGTSISSWNAVEKYTGFSGVIDAPTGPYVKVLDDNIISVVKSTVYEGTTDNGTDYGIINVVSEQEGEGSITVEKGQSVIFDFGQNFAGWVEFTVKGDAGTRLHLLFAEMLNDTGEESRANDGAGGSLYLANLRTAKAELYYTLCGDEDGETYSPTMTFYGFRYCEVTPTADVEIVSINGVPISSSHTIIGDISTDNEMVNQLISNIVWGQRSNLLSVPTDCPQRDERMGWTADTQVFSKTAMYNADVSSFYQKWMIDMVDGQREDGAYSDIAPVAWEFYGDGVWADAGIVVPWNVYLMSRNKAVIEDSYESMTLYMDWLATQGSDGYTYQGAGTSYGDWLSFTETDSRYVSVAYYAYDALLMAKMSRVLSTSDDDEYAQAAEEYETLFENIRDEFQSRYFRSSGAMKNPTQTACLLALRFGLYKDEDQMESIKTRLKNLIESNDDMLDTGFTGTAILNTTLSDFGMTDNAYDLLLQRDCPSWLYSIDQGATTMWERWDSYTTDSGFGSASMNSFNHYAYGAIGEWMYRNMAGIGADEDDPGFHHIILKPCIDTRTELPDGQDYIKNVECSYNSVYGVIESTWNILSDGMMDYKVVVPVNTTATVYIPVASESSEVYESSVLAEEAEGVEYVGYEDGYNVYEIGSGTYYFSSDAATNIDKITYNNKVRVYPNPVDDVLHIVSTDDISKITLVNVSGNLVKMQESNCESIDMSGLPSGIYMLTIWGSDEQSVTKIIKK